MNLSTRNRLLHLLQAVAALLSLLFVLSAITFFYFIRHELMEPEISRQQQLPPATRLQRLLQGESAPLIYAHRGVHHFAVENSRESVAMALKRKYDGVELDVAMTADSHLVITHDTIVSYEGRERSITELTLEQLKGVEPDLLSLESLLDEFGGRILFILEIKWSWDTASLTVPPVLTRQMCKIVRSRKLQGSVILSSLNFMVIRQLQKECPGVHLMFEIVGPASPLRKSLEKEYRSPFLSISLHSMDPAFMEWARERFKVISVFTPFFEQEMERAVQEGANLIQTDRPGGLTRLRNQMYFSRSREGESGELIR